MARPKYTKAQFDAEYPDDAACLHAIMEMRYGGTDIKCPACKKQSKFHLMAKRRGFSCQWCGHHIFPCVGTVFEKSRTPLTKWFYAMYLFTASRHGVPARELERQLGVTYKCAWRMAHELRKLMAMADDRGPMSGTVEVDETYLGGKPRYKNKPRRKKAMLLGLAQRGGPVRVGQIYNTDMGTLEGAITNNVRLGARVITDEHKSYSHVGSAGYDHHTVNHTREEYVRGDIYTNTIEGFWSRLKNSIKGTHIHVSEKHLWKYAAEFSYKYNMRKQPQEMFNRMILAVSLPRIEDA